MIYGFIIALLREIGAVVGKLLGITSTDEEEEDA